MRLVFAFLHLVCPFDFPSPTRGRGSISTRFKVGPGWALWKSTPFPLWTKESRTGKQDEAVVWGIDDQRKGRVVVPKGEPPGEDERHGRGGCLSDLFPQCTVHHHQLSDVYGFLFWLGGNHRAFTQDSLLLYAISPYGCILHHPGCPLDIASRFKGMRANIHRARNIVPDVLCGYRPSSHQLAAEDGAIDRPRCQPLTVRARTADGKES
ncbi:hypothetical protein QBC44DRAFT_127869 [Cladorrhinum sp. PSN332]|nr:hypothetical protein QBC44DRAFT_127869 [Cladorrhinum sp. PSN332]